MPYIPFAVLKVHNISVNVKITFYIYSTVVLLFHTLKVFETLRVWRLIKPVMLFNRN